MHFLSNDYGTNIVINGQTYLNISDVLSDPKIYELDNDQYLDTLGNA